MIGMATLTAATGWNDGHMGRGNGWWFVMTFCMVLVVAIVALVVWLVTRGSGGRGGSRSGLDDARSILASRLARGEIEPDEYRDRLQHLH